MPAVPGSPRLRRLLLALSAVGSLFFAGLLALSLIEPLWIERAAREVLRVEVERRVGERLDQLTQARVVQLAQKALGASDARIEASRRALRAELPQRVANAVADQMKADCECRKRLVEGAVRLAQARLRSMEQIREQLPALIEAAYRDVSRQLMRELRIFSGVNAFAFALLGVIALRKRGTTLQLLLPAGVLIGAAVFTALVYLFGQNWLHTIVFGRYVGWAYLAWYGLAAVWFVDLIGNRARITTHLVNGLLKSVGSLLHAVPC